MTEEGRRVAAVHLNAPAATFIAVLCIVLFSTPIFYDKIVDASGNRSPTWNSLISVLTLMVITLGVYFVWAEFKIYQVGYVVRNSDGIISDFQGWAAPISTLDPQRTGLRGLYPKRLEIKLLDGTHKNYSFIWLYDRKEVLSFLRSLELPPSPKGD